MNNIDKLIEQVAYSTVSISQLLLEYIPLQRYWIHKRSGKVVSKGSDSHLSVAKRLGLDNKLFNATVNKTEYIFTSAYKKGWVRAGARLSNGEVYLDTSSRLSKQDAINLVGDILAFHKMSGKRTWKVFVDTGFTWDIGSIGDVDYGRPSSYNFTFEL